MRNFLNKYYLYIKVLIISLVLIAFAMMFTTQVVVTTDLGTSVMEFIDVYFSGSFNPTVLGYGAILVAGVLLIASFFLSHKVNTSFILDIIAIILLTIGIILVSLVCLFYKDIYLNSICINEECISYYSQNISLKIDIGVIVCIIFSSLSLICSIILLINTHTYRKENIKDPTDFDIDDLPDEINEN